MFDVDLLLLCLLIFFGALQFVAGFFDRLIFYYKKTPGRGYAQIARPGRPRWLIALYSNIEIIAFLGFAATCLLLAWRYS